MTVVRLSPEQQEQLHCPRCGSTAIIDVWHCYSGRRLMRIGCPNEKCINYIGRAPTHDYKAAALRSWNARKWDGHYRREKKPPTPPDENTLNLF